MFVPFYLLKLCENLNTYKKIYYEFKIKNYLLD